MTISIIDAINNGDVALATSLLNDANLAYYSTGESSLTDSEYDTLSKAFKDAFGYEIKTGARNTTARTDRHANVPHDWVILSGWLDKADGTEAMSEWHNKRITQLEQSPLTVDDFMLGSPKWDGLSIVITYGEDGSIERALTRGENGMGVDVTHIFKNDEKHFPDIDYGFRFGVKYEAVMRWSDVEAMSTDLGKVYKNPRNTVAGIFNSDEGLSRRAYITLVPLDMEWDDCPDRMARLTSMQLLFETTEENRILYGKPILFTGNGDRSTPFIWRSVETEAELHDLYTEIHNLRESPDFDYMLDGIVVEFVDTNAIEALGGPSNDCPPYSVAVKFPSMVGRTKVISVDWDLGASGRLTPVVNYEPITLDGRTFKRTSISNMVRFDALKLAFGTPIIVEIRGDVLAWINRDGEDPEGSIPFDPPEECSYTYNRDGKRVYAYIDASLDGRIERMMLKMGVKGIRRETIRKLTDTQILNDLGSIWSIEQMHDQVASVQGMGESSAAIIADAINDKLKAGFWDWEILASVGITNIGRSIAKDALSVWTLDELLASAEPTLTSELITKIGPERTRMLLEGIEAFADDIRMLKEIALTAEGGYKCTKELQSASSGEKYKVVVTGDLANWERDAFKTYIEMLGHKMVSSMSKKVDFLITNDPHSGTVKNKKAIELGIRIITEDQAIEILGLERPANGTVTATSLTTAPLTISNSLSDL
jgi:DNA ligase (NAD+)